MPGGVRCQEPYVWVGWHLGAHSAVGVAQYSEDYCTCPSTHGAETQVCWNTNSLQKRQNLFLSFLSTRPGCFAVKGSAANEAQHGSKPNYLTRCFAQFDEQ